MKKVLIPILKFGIPIAIITWLLLRIPPADLQALQQRPKNLPLLGVALVFVFAAVSLTFFRWHLLVTALRLKFRLVDAFRLGFLGYLFNFISAGAVGGDLFKAFFLARQQPQRRAEAVATVVVDRMIGLYALLLLTTAIILCSATENTSSQFVTLSRVTIGSTIVGGLGILMVLIPGFTNGALSEMLAGLPGVGKIFGELISAVRIYRRRWPTLVIATVMSLGTHLLFATALYLIAHALFERVPTLFEHMVMIPLGMVAGAMPFTPAGFGAFEFAIEKLYEIVPAATNTDVSGVLVALVYRLMTIAVAAIGMVIYWFSRSEVQHVLEDVEQLHHETDAS